MTINPEGKITDINEATVRVLGSPREEIIGSGFAGHFTEPARVLADYRTVLSAGYVTNYPLSIRDSSGEVSHVLLNASVYRNPKGEMEGVLAVARDITQQKLHEEELAALQEQMTATVVELRRRERDTAIIGELSETLQSCKTDEEAYPLIAVAAKRLFPWSCGALAVFASGTRDLAVAARWGESCLMLPDFAIDDCWALRRGLHQLDGPGEGALCQHFETPPAGPYLCLPLTMSMEPLGLLHLSAVSAHPIDENDRRLAVTLGEVAELSLSNLRLREHLRMQAIRDPLTALFNRQYLAETLPREFQNARRQKVPLSVAILDIDHFGVQRPFSLIWRHGAGRWALLQRSVREIWPAVMRRRFLLVLPDCDLAMASARLEQIVEIKRKPCTFWTAPAVSRCRLECRA
jgi:PAS domain S-box-containing protein